MRKLFFVATSVLFLGGLLFSQAYAQPLDFGDAPEGALAYPATGIMGMFPTCIPVGPALWIQHTNFGAWFGPAIDFEPDGNGGLCPLFAPYDNDECFADGDAGLITPSAYTIVGGGVAPCPNVMQPGALGQTCRTATWGTNIDILVRNFMPSGTMGLVNVLMDWDQNGMWAGASSCPTLAAPEHVLVNFPVPNGFMGPLSALGPPPFLIGPNAGYVWTRFTISELPVPVGWDGSGGFEDGESEDYLLRIEPQAEPTMLPVITQCPVVETECPAGDTWCPAIPTRCPTEQTHCPVIDTTCPVIDTQCPAQGPTICPEVSTQCPVVQTMCPLVETACPGSDTFCPPQPTFCPLAPTQCPNQPTFCPPQPTVCDVTMCTPFPTFCPPVATNCPFVLTTCPVIDTACPLQPSTPTVCPEIATQCPVVPTVCQTPAPTVCPVDPTYCPLSDSDGDGVPDCNDNCPTTYNPGQEDSYPPGGNGCGNACECEGNFDDDADQDGTDASTFKRDFGRSKISGNPCSSALPCNGDFECDTDVDGTNASMFKTDFGRSKISGNPCPICPTDPWCVYP